MIDAAEFVQTYGYIAVLVGTFFEGETILLAAAFLAQCGYLHLPTVCVLAAGGGFLGDQLFFRIGRHGGGLRMLQRRKDWQTLMGRIRRLLEVHGTLLVLLCRFMYGMRIATPIIVGASGYPPLRFLLLNLAGAALWSLVIGGVGYLGGMAAGHWLHAKGVAVGVAVAIALIGPVATLWSLYRHHHRSKTSPPPA